jgi:3-methyladenine DNA glycosylase AlkD
MNPYIAPLTQIIEANANPDEAVKMKAYMRGQFEYLGIKSPLRKQLTKEFLAAHGKPEISELPEIIRDLWERPEREFQYVAMALTYRFKKKAPAEFIELYEHMIVTKSWWDTIDMLADNEVGTLFQRFPNVRDTYLAKWRVSDNIWLRRTCLLFQMKYKQDTDVDLLFAIIEENLDSREFFIQKAIGWALRTLSRHQPEVVKDYVARTPLFALSEREALKWMKNKGML